MTRHSAVWLLEMSPHSKLDAPQGACPHVMFSMSPVLSVASDLLDVLHEDNVEAFLAADPATKVALTE